jgi:hypothetical protein
MLHLKMLTKVQVPLFFLTSAWILLSRSTCHAGHANTEGDVVLFGKKISSFASYLISSHM